MSRARVRVAKVVVALWAVGGAGGVAFAGDNRREADNLIRHGVELRMAHDDEAAAREFRKAYDLVPTPRAAAQLGLAKQALGLWEDAERYVSEAMRAAKDEWVAKNRATLNDALGTIQMHLARLEVIGDPEGAEVAVKGRPIGKLPLAEAVRVSAGEVDIDVRAPGYSPVQRTLTLIGGQYQRVVIHLTKVDAAPAPLPLPALASTNSEPASTPTSTAAPRDAAEGGSFGSRSALKWTAGCLAGAGLATGMIGTVLHGNNLSKFEDHPCRNKDGAGVLPDGTPDSTCQSLLDSFRTDQTIAIVGFVAAGAFAATWLALFLTEPSPPAGPAAHAARRPSCAPNLGAVGVSCVARF
jgi:hypothetical protein